MIVKVKEPVRRGAPPAAAGADPLHLSPPGLVAGVDPCAPRSAGHRRGLRDDAHPDSGEHPLLAPMSEVAGRLSVQIGISYLRKDQGGSGVLLGGVPGVPRGRVTIVGGGVVGLNAAKVAAGLGAEVTVLDVNPARAGLPRRCLPGGHRDAHVEPLHARRGRRPGRHPGRRGLRLGRAGAGAGARGDGGPDAPRVGRSSTWPSTREGASPRSGRRPTPNPTYVVHGVTHYGVTNMPGVVPRTSTLALTNVTAPYVWKIARLGIERAVGEDAVLREGVNLIDGRLVQPKVAEAHGLCCESLRIAQPRRASGLTPPPMEAISQAHRWPFHAEFTDVSVSLKSPCMGGVVIPIDSPRKSFHYRSPSSHTPTSTRKGGEKSRETAPCHPFRHGGKGYCTLSAPFRRPGRMGSGVTPKANEGGDDLSSPDRSIRWVMHFAQGVRQ